MTPILLDTHVWAWSFMASGQLSARARSALLEAADVYVSPISFYEISHKVRLGKWPEAASSVASLPSILLMQGGAVAPLTYDICLHAGQRDWSHRDPFDRLLASTAELLGLTLVSQDPAFRSLKAINCIW